MSSSKLTASARRARAQLRKHLKSKERTDIDLACAQFKELADAPEMRGIVEELVEGTHIDAQHCLQLGTELTRRVRKPNQAFVGLWALWALGQLDDVTSLQLLGWSDTFWNMDFLEGLSNLASLKIFCTATTSLDVLGSLTSLERLEIRRCDVLTDVDVLGGLTGLQWLSIHECPALQDSALFSGMTGLEALYLHGCKSLKNVDGLAGLSQLQQLQLSWCTSLESIDGLTGLASLRSLSLHGSSALTSIDALSSRPELKITGFQT